ncbi:MAG: DEAD/DEAH box helicase [Paludibacter sp.]|nr:DEAD/DEAH box helicase [Bacteroidales bacterium]MCM1069329.1 DEAD/DEAH box helicase [Prevotella sp.]MCM1353849.1 DEAD/DEAH box helicase [Bacteroides sp.]MCM1442901.1 DEAD/DEAH box helicase [Muribaculum sp.]MCM1481946.1 DEAD/DEAH box helicase [Paludibacter sp.]
MYFDELPLEDEILDGLDAMHFEECTPVQAETIPVILDGQDVISCAQTGTGKTAAYILPLLNNLLTDNHDPHGVNAIIMAPTRELAQQIDQQMQGFSYFLPFSSVAVYGGNDGNAWDTQKRGLTQGADIVVATPGRLLSHMNVYKIDFSKVRYFILDEADRMLDMGFFDDIMTIVRQLPQARQTILFSATMPKQLRALAKTFMNNPTEVNIAISRPPESIRQRACVCYETQKLKIVENILAGKQLKKVILFVGKKQKVKELYQHLRHKKIEARQMHSDLDQKERDEVMLDFRNGKVDILVATDIVSRGIDVDDIPLVINYDVPRDAEDYVHRIGRTARAESDGEAITLVSEKDQLFFSRIENFLNKSIERLPVPTELGDTPPYNPQPSHKGKRNTQGRSNKNKRQSNHNYHPKKQRPNHNTEQ